jgi:hypothetical protein
MDVDLLCNGEIQITDEVGQQIMAEITTEPVLVTTNAVCQCLVFSDYGSVQDDDYVNITACE